MFRLSRAVTFSLNCVGLIAKSVFKYYGLDEVHGKVTHDAILVAIINMEDKIKSEMIKWIK